MSSSDVSMQQLTDHSSTANFQQHAEEAPQPDSEELTATIERLCMSSAVGKSSYYGPSSALSFSRILGSSLRSLRVQGPGLTMGGIRDSILQQLPRPEPAPLPGQLFGQLLEISYFEHVHPQYPFLHRPTFQLWQDEVYRATEAGIQPSQRHLFFVYMVPRRLPIQRVSTDSEQVYAVGALVTPTSSPTPAENFEAAAETALDAVLSDDGLECVQAILCCAMYSMRSISGASLWTLSGFALRQCIELGYHRITTWPLDSVDVLTAETRKRAFWVAYTIDRSASFSLGRPFGIGDSDISVDLPLDIDDENVTSGGLLCQPSEDNTRYPTTLSAAIHGIKMRRIWGDMQSIVNRRDQTNSTTNAEYAQIRQKLQDWLNTHPGQDRQPGTSSVAFGSRKWYELSYNHTLLLMHRRRLEDLTLSSNENLASVYLECAASASAICTIYRDFYLTSTVNYTGWGALHVLFVAGLVFIHCLCVSNQVRSTYSKHEVSSICTSCTIVLVIMTERWAAAQPYRDTFNMLSDRAQAMLSNQEGGRQELSLPLVNSEEASSGINGIAQLGMCNSVRNLLHDMAR
ncbi:uncharacterized protein LTR77_010937 [Saxophila tyrrhenica]|uniref:Xylanolytic transcriptional activator regulatory domain-containing protein n=1 Tax=Saxophila tyrrhenica TaxID=1690608 RepID=A0AAV9NUI8_9PEZI|nr:hypothetical protein LTR77_010937 [Saxophila tyrrhenica]